MKKTLAMTLIILGLGAGQALVPVSFAQAGETNVSTENTEKDWLDALNTQIDLAQAKVAALKAQIALEIENSSERAQQALDEAEARLMSAKDTASAEVARKIDELREDVRAAKDAITQAPAEAREKVGELATDIEERIQEYGQIALETDEAKLLKKRYAQLQAQVALLRAQLAEKTDETGDQAMSYLDQAKDWYADAKANASEEWQDGLNAISDSIDAAKVAVQNQREKASKAITDLAEWAANLMKGTEAE